MGGYGLSRYRGTRTLVPRPFSRLLGNALEPRAGIRTEFKPSSPSEPIRASIPAA